jgi:acetyl esterase/lipase
MKRLKFFTLLIAIAACSVRTFSQNPNSREAKDVIYGMVSGTALLMDIYKPVKSNHKAIIFIPGSAWGFVYPQNYNQTPLKDDVTLDSSYTGKWVKSLVQNNYTVFVINHRFTPKFQYQDIIEDCRRAVRFVRYNADKFLIDPLQIGAMGHSSGGNLASLLGTTDSIYSGNKSPIDSASSKVQAVVTLAAPFNLADINKPEDSNIDNNFVLSAVAAYMGSLPSMKNGDFILTGKYIQASSYAMVTKDDAPTLIYYSDNDPVISVRQAKTMYEKLLQNNVPCKILLSPKTEHSPIPDMVEVCRWFEKYLK